MSLLPNKKVLNDHLFFLQLFGHPFMEKKHFPVNDTPKKLALPNKSTLTNDYVVNIYCCYNK